jgi:hypothetical protein
MYQNTHLFSNKIEIITQSDATLAEKIRAYTSIYFESSPDGRDGERLTNFQISHLMLAIESAATKALIDNITK